MVRAYNPVPGAWFMAGAERTKCWQAQRIDAEGPAGTVLAVGADGVDIACGQGALRLQQLQRPGKRPVSAAEYAAQVDLTGQQL